VTFGLGRTLVADADSAFEFRSDAELLDPNSDVTFYGFGFAVSWVLVNERPIANALIEPE
jgi:hypothetical protein